MPTIRENIEQWRTRFALAGVDSPRLTAELIVAHVLGLTRGDLPALSDRPLDAHTQAQVDALCARRERREPLAYIVGEREFYSRTFAVTPDVLIPRPETETIIDLVRRLLPRDFGGSAADTGTGSGCLAVTLALEFPNLRVIATDLSAAALRVAAANAARHAVRDRVLCVRGDLMAPLARGLSMCVSNPPYVDPADAPGMQPEVRDFEPHAALFADDRGLAAARAVIQQAAQRLLPGALLLLEFGAGQHEAIAEAARQSGLEGIEIMPDPSGIPRVLVARAVRPSA